MNAGVQRRRLACAECTRKKIKCDKVIPCRNCTRRGHPCYRIQPETTRSRPVQRSEPLEGNITSCIQELQATLRAVRHGNSIPPLPVQAAPSLPETASSSTCNEAAEVEDAATILEFLAWGRRKAQYDRPAPGLEGPPGDVALDADDYRDHGSFLQLSSDTTSLSVLQILLPESPCLKQTVDYHCESLLWYHASFHPIVFQREVRDFQYKNGGRIDHNVDLQWVALLFAVLAGSITCAPPSVAYSWGFRDQERCTIARRWFKAALVCLQKADYTSNHSIYAVQCIATMTISAHMLGHSNSHSVMLATGVRIAQSLGLHMVGIDEDPNTATGRETKRRVWTELCIQDWFSIPFSESYLIHLLDFKTTLPMNCDDEDMIPLPDDIPTNMTYHRILYQIARLMPQLQDDMAQSNTLYTKYEHVLQYDTQMRAIASRTVPAWLRANPLEPSWPRYVPWARRCLAISSAHKIIMIHRKFLWSSFTNPAFSFTRNTCIAAAKTILRECSQVAEEDGPVLWIHHAFAVAAGIILTLDLLFRSLSDTEHNGHADLVQHAVDILRRNKTSMIAKRGVTILSLLHRVEQSRRLPTSDSVPLSPDEERYSADVARLVQGLVGTSEVQRALNLNRQSEPTSPIWSSGAQNQEEVFASLLVPHSRLEPNQSLEDLLFLAQAGPGY
ncbi:hypothetical protein BJX99DRAFT_259715 [Aspergillus californicus]